MHSWQLIPVSEIHIRNAKSIVPDKNPDQTYELYSVPSFDSKIPEIITGKDIGSSKQIVEKNTVLLCKINPRINRVWIVGNHSKYPKIASTEWIPFQYVSGILPEYLCYFMQNGAFREFISTNVSGVGGSLMRIKASTISNYPFPLPPLPEQRAIVSRIEQLFSDLDNGIANLRLAQEQLKVYRQAVLKKAFEGELTRKWRQQQTDLPDARDLLELIRKEREEAAKVSGKKMKPVKPLTEDEIDELPGLPEGWIIARMEELSTKVVDGVHKKPNYIPLGVPFITVRNLTAGNGISFQNVNYISEEDHQEFCKRACPELGDILITKDGTLGVVRVIKTEKQFSIFVSVAMMKPIKTHLNSDYLSYFIESPLGQKQMTKIGKGVGLKHLHLENLREIIFFLPPLPEQHAIVEEIETRLSVCDKMAQEIDEALEKAEALRQSILKKAFEGKLLSDRELAEVRMAEDWEPAEVLLERIRAERVGNGKK